ncbi:MAG TPA: cation diffusion facilitator family transporter [Polyangiaceae bacterium]|nr:cation diffusion facilitator family transporter [Polyangiaceae bacterium]
MVLRRGPAHGPHGSTGGDAHGGHGHSGMGAGAEACHGHAHGSTDAHGHAHGSTDSHGSTDAHGHAHGASVIRAAQSALTIALGLTAAFLVVEAVVGWLSGSLTLLADAGHMLADSAALALSLAAQRFAAKPRTPRSTFGSRRAEVLAAFVNGMTLTAVAALIAKEAVERWLAPVAIDAKPVLITACLGLAVNLVVAAVLTRGQGSNANVRAALAHVLSDALGSVAAIASACLVMWFDYYRADPLLSGVVALLIARSSYRILRETSGVLLEGVPSHLDVQTIQATIAGTPGVLEVHDLHVWTISEDFDALSVHIVIERGQHGTEMCRAVADRLRREHGLEHVTIQPEPAPPDDVVQVRRSQSGGVLTPPPGAATPSNH